MGDSTNNLMSKAKKISPKPSPREIDMLLSTGEQISISLLTMALHELNIGAVSLTGAQSGIITDSYHNKARINKIKPTRIKEELTQDNVVIVAGFQGISQDNNITTLGRGGSDTTAVALASALSAEKCEIYTDVDGIYTTDPRICSDASKIEAITYNEMLEFAKLGAKVLHPRAVEIASKYELPLVVRSSFNFNKGTKILKEATMEKVLIRGIALDNNIKRITVTKVPDKPGIAFKLFSILAQNNIQIDTIIQNLNHEKLNDISFTIESNDLDKVLSICEKFSNEYPPSEVLYKDSVSKLSIIGTGISSNTEIAAKFFEALYELGINIEMISTSEIKISCIVSSKKVKEAVNKIHDVFKLDQINFVE